MTDHRFKGVEDLDIPQIELRGIETLIAYAHNARTHSKSQRQQVRQSFKQFGWTNPILVDNMGIVAGHGRCHTAQEMYDAGEQISFPNGVLIPLGLVPVIDCTGWDAQQRRAYILADNQLALNAGWDEDLLSLELTDLADGGFDVSVIGFSMEELDKYLNDVEPMPTMPELPTEERSEFEQMTFTLHRDQAAAIKQALSVAKDQGAFDGPNKNSNGNALARICETFLGLPGIDGGF